LTVVAAPVFFVDACDVTQPAWTIRHDSAPSNNVKAENQSQNADAMLLLSL
jgi:hypothetical protein